MKKYLFLALVLMMVLSLAACDGGGDTTDPEASQPGQADEQNENSIINASGEAWFSSTTNIAYVFLSDGKYESYTLEDGIWETNGNGTYTYKIDEDSLTIDSTDYIASLKDDTLTFTVNDNDYSYVRTSPFNPEQPSEGGLDENLVLPDGQAWIWEKSGLITGYVFNADGTYSYHTTDTWILQSSGTWSTNGNTLELDNQGKRPYTYVLNSDGLTLSDSFGDVYGPYAAQATPSAN